MDAWRIGHFAFVEILPHGLGSEHEMLSLQPSYRKLGIAFVISARLIILVRESLLNHTVPRCLTSHISLLIRIPPLVPNLRGTSDFRILVTYLSLQKYCQWNHCPEELNLLVQFLAGTSSAYRPIQRFLQQVASPIVLLRTEHETVSR